MSTLHKSLKINLQVYIIYYWFCPLAVLFSDKLTCTRKNFPSENSICNCDRKSKFLSLSTVPINQICTWIVLVSQTEPHIPKLSSGSIPTTKSENGFMFYGMSQFVTSQNFQNVTGKAQLSQVFWYFFHVYVTLTSLLLHYTRRNTCQYHRVNNKFHNFTISEKRNHH